MAAIKAIALVASAVVLAAAWIVINRYEFRTISGTGAAVRVWRYDRLRDEMCLVRLRSQDVAIDGMELFWQCASRDGGR